MIQEIQFSGVTAQPSDYQSPDGALTTAINLIPEDGQLNPVLPPKQIAKLPTGYTIAFIHKTANYCHYIVRHSEINIETHVQRDFLFCVDQSDMHGNVNVGSPFFQFPNTYLLDSISAIGNTLIIPAKDGLHYLLWKDDEYKYLGQHLPELPISFSLAGESVVSEKYELNLMFSKSLRPAERYVSVDGDMEYRPKDNPVSDFGNEHNYSILTEPVLAKVNNFIAEKSVRDGKFLFPFFVRYALRLFDGSLTMHSSPVLMVTSSGTCPQAIITAYMNQDANYYASIRYCIAAMLFDLEYKASESVASDQFKDWKEIIKSVDIFVSAPIYTYDQSGMVTGLSCLPKTSFSMSRPTESNTDKYFKYLVQDRYNLPELDNIERYEFGQNLYTYGQEEFILPKFKEEQVTKSINDCCNFYLFKSIPIEELKYDERTKLPLDRDFLSGLVARERMTDEYNGHDYLIPRFTSVYNSRLHIGNISKLNANPVSPDAYVSYTNYSENNTTGTNEYKLFVYIKEGGNDIVVTHTSDASTLGHQDDFPFLYFYYPNPNAYKVIVSANRNGIIQQRDIQNADIPNLRNLYELHLTQHDFLNGAYYFGGWNTIPSCISKIEPDTTNAPIPIPNKLYVSEVGNPFFFPVTSINTIGSGELIGISSASKALSQGQFGQFPLYAFCTDGVWALSVNSTGGYSTVQPITRDVCTSKESITSTDSEVLFATDRGIMLLSGSSASCISDAINTKHQFDVLGLPGMEKLHDEILGHKKDGCLPMVPFLDFIKGCRMLYDYVHQRILLFNQKYTYAYIFSLKSKQWGIMKSNISSALNSYPDALAMTKNFALVTFNEFGEEHEKCMLVTRPFKLGNPDMLKTIHSLFIRGQFSNKDACAVLYGTRDMEHWHLVGSSWNHKLRYLRGSGYKAFILASVATLTEAKTLTGATVEFIPRQTNKLL